MIHSSKFCTQPPLCLFLVEQICKFKNLQLSFIFFSLRGKKGASSCCRWRVWSLKCWFRGVYNTCQLSFVACSSLCLCWESLHVFHFVLWIVLSPTLQSWTSERWRCAAGSEETRTSLNTIDKRHEFQKSSHPRKIPFWFHRHRPFWDHHLQWVRKLHQKAWSRSCWTAPYRWAVAWNIRAHGQGPWWFNR